MIRWTDVRQLLTQHPRVADALLALLLLGPALGIPVDASGGDPLPQTAISRVLALAGIMLLTARRRAPVTVWLATAALASGSVWEMHGGSGAVLPSLLALYTLATRMESRRAIAAGLGEALALLFARALAAPPQWASPTTYAVLVWCMLAVVLGFAIRGQRRMVAAAQERARIAEESREEEAQRRVSEERLRIARDLHDVVAHHIAVITVQAGVAEHLLDADPARARAAIGHVRVASREVLAEMGTLLGVLRADDTVTREPAHGLADIDTLIASSRQTGLRVVIRREGPTSVLPPLADVTAYRVLEEALTNAHRHGVDGSAEVLVAQAAGSMLIEVRNRCDVQSSASTGSGHGLLGMRERVTSIGGKLSAGPDGHGWFVVRATLPTEGVVDGEAAS